MPIPIAAGFAVARGLPWKWIVAAALVAALVVQTLRLDASHEKVRRLQAELQSLSNARNQQKAETGRNIERAKERIVYVDREARRVEQAKPPGNCEQPKEVRDAEW